MSNYLRDTQPTVVHIDSDVIRATVGLQELLARPSVTLKACYAVPKAGSSSRSLPATEPAGDADAKDDGRGAWLVGAELEAAMKAEGEGAAGRLDVRWPFRAGKQADDWEGREYILSHLYTLLSLRIPTNVSPLLLVPPPSPAALPLPTQAQYCQLAFEQLNVPGLSILPTPLAAIFALNSTTGLVVHVGRSSTEISIVVDSIVRWECGVSVGVGLEECEARFEEALMRDEALGGSLREAVGEGWREERKGRLVKEVAEVIWRECTGEDVEVPPAKVGSKAFVASMAVAAPEESEFDVARKLIGDPAPASAPSHKSKKAQQAATDKANRLAADAAAAAEAALLADTITIQIPSLPEKDIIVGAVRHRLCEPLLVGEGGRETVWEGMGRAVESASLSVGERMAGWEGVGVVGEVARIRSFAPALMTYLSPFLLSTPDIPSDTQPARVRLLSIPDYFTNFKGATSELAPFLGASMVAKMAFTDSVGKHCITKIEYNARGPAAIYAVTNEE